MKEESSLNNQSYFEDSSLTDQKGSAFHRNGVKKQKVMNLLPSAEREFWKRDGCIYSVQFSCSVMTDSLWPHGLQHTRLPCPSPTPRAYSNSCPSSQWCHPTIYPLSSPSPPAFSLSQHQGLFQWISSSHQVTQSIRVSASASVLPMNIQDWFPLGLTGLLSLQSKGLSRVFSNTIVQKHQFFGAQVSL